MPEYKNTHTSGGFLRYGMPVLLAVITLAVVGGLAYLAGWQGIERGDGELVVALTVAPSPADIPFTRAFQLDPAIMTYLNAPPPAVTTPETSAALPPLGAYLPRTGNVGVAFETTAEAPPTPRPYVTGTPFPLPSVPPAPTLIPSPVPVTQAAPTDVPAVAAAPSAPSVPPDTECAPSGLPVSGLLTQYFHTYHIGIDLGAPLGSPVYATHSGTVIFADWSNIGYGYLVIIRNGAFITYYAHNTSLNVIADQEISKGSIIAWSGSTGNSTGPHVHYETRINDVPVDPLTFEDRGYTSC